MRRANAYKAAALAPGGRRRGVVAYTGGPDTCGLRGGGERDCHREPQGAGRSHPGATTAAVTASYPSSSVNASPSCIPSGRSPRGISTGDAGLSSRAMRLQTLVSEIAASGLGAGRLGPPRNDKAGWRLQYRPHASTIVADVGTLTRHRCPGSCRRALASQTRLRCALGGGHAHPLFAGLGGHRAAHSAR